MGWVYLLYLILLKPATIYSDHLANLDCILYTHPLLWPFRWGLKAPPQLLSWFNNKSSGPIIHTDNSAPLGKSWDASVIFQVSPDWTDIKVSQRWCIQTMTRKELTSALWIYNLRLQNVNTLKAKDLCHYQKFLADTLQNSFNLIPMAHILHTKFSTV